MHPSTGHPAASPSYYSTSGSGRTVDSSARNASASLPNNPNNTAQTKICFNCGTTDADRYVGGQRPGGESEETRCRPCYKYQYDHHGLERSPDLVEAAKERARQGSVKPKVCTICGTTNSPGGFVGGTSRSHKDSKIRCQACYSYHRKYNGSERRERIMDNGDRRAQRSSNSHPASSASSHAQGQSTGSIIDVGNRRAQRSSSTHPAASGSSASSPAHVHQSTSHRIPRSCCSKCFTTTSDKWAYYVNLSNKADRRHMCKRCALTLEIHNQDDGFRVDWGFMV